MDATNPQVTSREQVLRRSAYQSIEPVRRPEWWGVDRDPDRRPGVPMMREPKPFPHARPPTPQQGVPAVPRHGRPNKPMPPVFSTAMPLHGLSGVVKRLAYRLPDHKPAHWILKLAGDRVENATHRARKWLPFAVPLVALWAVFGRED
jgi:hypothetical protein